MNTPPPKTKVLVIRFSSLGDVVLSTVLFPNIRAQWPDSEISVLTKAAYERVFDNNPFVDHVLVFDPSRQPFSQLAKEIRENGYEVVIDLQANPRSWMVRLLAGGHRTVTMEKSLLARRALVWFRVRSRSLTRSVRERMLDCLKPLDIPIVNEETQLYPTGVDRLLETFSIPTNVKLLGIAPGAKHATKRWKPENFAIAANRLGALAGSMVVLLGDKADRPLMDVIAPRLTVPYKDLTGWTNLSEFIGIISRCSFVLTNDSASMHIAEAFGIPLVAIFGPTVRDFGFAPYRRASRVVEVRNLSCRPCSLHGGAVCPMRHHKCMEDVDPNAVLLAASSALESEDVAVAGGPS